MLPNFFILGVQKAATTWLAKCLREHPDVFMPDEKEPCFFNEYFHKGLDWYEAQHFSDWAGQTAVGEATPGYIYFPEVPGRIRATLDENLKFIVSLRHPVDRAYSAFWMFLSRGYMPIDADFSTFFQQDLHGLRTRGNYSVQLKHYLEYFPRENFLVLLYEETKQDPSRAVGSCFEFLGVDSEFSPKILEARVNKHINVSIFHHQVWEVRRTMKKIFPRSIEQPLASAGRRIFDLLPKQNSYKPLDEELRQGLFQTYGLDVKELEDLLNQDLSIWYGASST
jgi:hypothetical protein